VRSLLVVVLVSALAAVGSAQRAPEPVRGQSAPIPATPTSAKAPTLPDGFDTLVRPFLSRNCFTCHGNKKQEKGLNLQSFESVRSLVDHVDRWEEVISKLRGKEMPPIEEEQPEEEDRQAVATWLAEELERIERRRPIPDA
jgi:mono/diheme cytochrome c family protein